MAIWQKNLAYSTHFLTGTHTYIDAPTHAHSHSHKHMRMRHISPRLLCWIHPNMVGDISMATAGRRGADLSWMISRESLLFDFWFKLFSISSFNSAVISSAPVKISAASENTQNPASVTYRLPWKCNYNAWTVRLQILHALVLTYYLAVSFVFVLSNHCFSCLFVFNNLGPLIMDLHSTENVSLKSVAKHL